MTNNSLSDLTPIAFLQTFIIELMHASEQLGPEQSQQLIENIALTAGCFFEEVYRSGSNNKDGSLNIESYIELILGLKNNIGGNFSLTSRNQDCIAVCNSSCPFGDEVVSFPELCRMTSSVFGGIAARNFGYVKVEIAKSIAQHNDCCEVYIHLNPESAKNRPGIEYRDYRSENKHDQKFEVLQSRQARHATSRNSGTPVTFIHSPTQRMGDALNVLRPPRLRTKPLRQGYLK